MGKYVILSAAPWLPLSLILTRENPSGSDIRIKGYYLRFRFPLEKWFYSKYNILCQERRGVYENNYGG